MYILKKWTKKDWDKNFSFAKYNYVYNTIQQIISNFTTNQKKNLIKLLFKKNLDDDKNEIRLTLHNYE